MREREAEAPERAHGAAHGWRAECGVANWSVRFTPSTVPPPILTDPTLSGGGYLYRLFTGMGLSRHAALLGEFLIVGPLRVFTLAILGFVVSRVGRDVIAKGVASARRRAPLRSSSARTDQRSRTVGEALGSLWVVVVGVLTFLMIFQTLGVNLGPLLAGAGVAGIAIALGAQALIRDYLSGLFVLFEDQFSVGDQVTIGTVSGTVEDLTLRLTKVRSADGTVWFIPNGEVRVLGNQSLKAASSTADATAHAADGVSDESAHVVPDEKSHI